MSRFFDEFNSYRKIISSSSISFMSFAIISASLKIFISVQWNTQKPRRFWGFSWFCTYLHHTVEGVLRHLWVDIVCCQKPAFWPKKVHILPLFKHWKAVVRLKVFPWCRVVSRIKVCLRTGRQPVRVLDLVPTRLQVTVFLGPSSCVRSLLSGRGRQRKRTCRACSSFVFAH